MNATDLVKELKFKLEGQGSKVEIASKNAYELMWELTEIFYKLGVEVCYMRQF